MKVPPIIPRVGIASTSALQAFHNNHFFQQQKPFSCRNGASLCPTLHECFSAMLTLIQTGSERIRTSRWGAQKRRACPRDAHENAQQQNKHQNSAFR
ncbi:MAG: HNH endonuclease [Candidatus Xenobiia bacterium LiM19]